MNKFYKEDGNLSSDGESALQMCFDLEIETLLRDFASSEADLQVIGSLLMKRVADIVSKKLAIKKGFTARLNSMSNEQFFAYLKAAYGDKWRVKKLRPEETERVNTMLQDRSESEKCTGSWVQTEFEPHQLLIHGEFTYCPVHDKK